MIEFKQIGWTLMAGNIAVFALACVATLVLGALDPGVGAGGLTAPHSINRSFAHGRRMRRPCFLSPASSARGGMIGSKEERSLMTDCSYYLFIQYG